jgi:predicted CoA-substrate-specific enzyme activase
VTKITDLCEQAHIVLHPCWYRIRLAMAAEEAVGVCCFVVGHLAKTPVRLFHSSSETMDAMELLVGIDIGSISAKLAATPNRGNAFEFRRPLLEESNFRLVGSAESDSPIAPILISKYQRTFGNPVQIVSDLLSELTSFLPRETIYHIRVTGSGASLVADSLGARSENEFKAIATAVGWLYPKARTVFEIGGESSKYFRLTPSASVPHAEDPELLSVASGITDYSTSGECAAGTGSFLDQQASRLQYRVEDIGSVVAGAKLAARIAGRCSVFAKSDMIHAQQHGYKADEVLKGLCEAVARNFRSNIVRGKPIVPPIALIGAVSQNSGIVQALIDAFRLQPGSIFVPDLYAWLGALGCALLERSEVRPALKALDQTRVTVLSQTSFAPLRLDNVLLLRDHAGASHLETLPERAERIPVYLGIDVGSVSTNLVLLGEAGGMLHEIYLYTAGRPIEVVEQGLKEIDRLFGTCIEVLSVGVTGSGRELIGELVGADTVNDEITAHKTGAVHVHEKWVRNRAATSTGNSHHSELAGVDTIFEIGGQDAKFISIDRGIVVDFAMNEACAAGTGSFLEEQAERLGIQIKGEFAQRALVSKSPARLGERCTVFMERDVTAAMQRGASIDDLCAGLAYSVALNYLNRVVRGRKIGNVIYFQGGTAYNDAVAAAFSQILGKRIIVPPHNGVIGAIGVALIAREEARVRKRDSTGDSQICSQLLPISTFRGFDLSKTRFETREFVCKACPNYCGMKEITIDGRKTYWGDKCSDKFRKRARTERKPIIDDLIAFHDQVLRKGYIEPVSGGAHDKPLVGIPHAMFYFDRFPFWRRYLEGLDFQIEVSSPTNSLVATRGVELASAEPCFPVQIAHGHVQSLLEESADHKPVDYVFLPNVMDTEAPNSPTPSHLCPWNQTLPFVVRSSPVFEPHLDQFLSPTVYFRLGRAHVKKQLADYFKQHFGIHHSQSDAAVDAACDAQADVTARLLAAGQEACEMLEKTCEPAILLVGRPYNIYDRGGNCDVPRKLRDLYGANVLPLDFLPLDDSSVDDLHSNMFWNSGRRILAAGRFAKQHPNVHIIYITNFKCGPDSFVKFFLRDVVKEPFLVLQFDGHGNDAGYLTRCEAYLDSKGLLRCPVNV